MDTESSPPPISQLIERYDQEVHYLDDRAAAEFAYVVAVRLRADGRVNEARDYARRCLSHAEKIPSQTLDEVTSERLSIGGVPMPERFHDGVVRARLGDLLED